MTVFLSNVGILHGYGQKSIVLTLIRTYGRDGIRLLSPSGAAGRVHSWAGRLAVRPEKTVAAACVSREGSNARGLLSTSRADVRIREKDDSSCIERMVSG